jgi:hypothetical protein
MPFADAACRTRTLPYVPAKIKQKTPSANDSANP